MAGLNPESSPLFAKMKQSVEMFESEEEERNRQEQADASGEGISLEEHGWEEHYDEIADANYYYHVPTQLTTWDKPTARHHRSVSVGAHTPGVKKFSLAKITHLPEGWE